MPHTSAHTTSVLNEEISSNIHQLNHHAASIAQFMQHVPHICEWDSNSGVPRPSFWTDIKHIYRRHRFLHRKQFRVLINTLSGYNSFDYRARELLFRDSCDLWRLERLSWTYAQVARYVNEGLQDAQQSGKWRRKQLSNEFCAALVAFLDVQIDWLSDLDVSCGTVYIMAENSFVDKLAILLKLPVVREDLRLRRIVAVWKHECYLGPASVDRSPTFASEAVARRFMKPPLQR